MLDNYTRRYTVTRVIDGDTLEGTIDLGFHFKWEEQRIRLAGVQTPERGQKGYDEAILFVKKFLAQGEIFVKVVNYRKDKYGRFLGEIYVVVDDTKEIKCLNTELLEFGYAVPYVK
jgi:micrococcal nuclease